jgi:lipoprotein-releasing system permease protein
VVVVMAALAICFLATIYPSRQAARLDPAQALRYE